MRSVAPKNMRVWGIKLSIYNATSMQKTAKRKNACPKTFSASSYFFCPSFIDVIVAVPTPIVMPTARRRRVGEKHTVIAAIASSPQALPTKILSTILYAALIIVAKMVGTEYLNISIVMLPSPNSFTYLPSIKPLFSS